MKKNLKINMLSRFSDFLRGFVFSPSAILRLFSLRISSYSVQFIASLAFSTVFTENSSAAAHKKWRQMRGLESFRGKKFVEFPLQLLIASAWVDNFNWLELLRIRDSWLASDAIIRHSFNSEVETESHTFHTNIKIIVKILIQPSCYSMCRVDGRA